MGRTKAAVLPLPVMAQASTSFPAIAWGMASAWMGVGRVKPRSWIPATRLWCSLSEPKGITEVILGALVSPFRHSAHRQLPSTMNAELIVLRLIHIVGGVFWVGSALFTAFFLMPTLMQAGPSAAGPVMGGLQQRKLMVWLPVVAVLVMLSGL